MSAGWLIGGDYDDWKTTEPEPRDVEDEADAREEAALERAGL